jgi:exopolysaccharide biosynthesis polyprenyl glycosylphosphotransferase
MDEHRVVRRDHDRAQSNAKVGFEVASIGLTGLESPVNIAYGSDRSAAAARGTPAVHSLYRRMCALEAGKPTDPVTEAFAGPVESSRARFALSIRERRVLLAAADLIVAALSTIPAYAVGHRTGNHPLQPYDPLMIGGIWVIALLITDGYAFQIPSSRIESSVAVLKALPVAALFAVLAFFLQPYVLTRPVIVYALVIGALLLIVMRTTLARLLLHESLAVRALLVSDTEPSAEITSALQAARFEYRVVGRLIGPVDQGAKLVQRVRELVRRSGAQELIVSNNELRMVPGLVEECLTHGVRLVSAGDLVERYTGRAPIESIDVHWYLGLPDNDVWRRPYAVARRLSDLLLAFVLSLPFLVVLPFIALAIKLDSRGPVFHVQRRVGEGGREFNLLKLRTMTDDAEAGGAQYAARADPRVTKVGRLLRTTRLDEFPQLLNIVRGDMSFIGPRPERPEFVTDLEARIPHFRSRLLIKPGLTGWAQIKGGYASTTDEMTQKLEYDLYYIKNRSLRLDLQILGGTFITVIRRRGV